MLSAVIFLTSTFSIAQVAINNDGSLPNSSAMLDVKASNAGFLPPRMTSSQRDAINTPAEGLLIYNTTTKCIELYKNNTWIPLRGDTGAPPPATATVTNPTTGEIWMDRNLGASHLASSSTDADAYGNLYQWGRLSDWHESRFSITTNLSSM